MPVNRKVTAVREESDFCEALGTVGEGPLVAYYIPHHEDLDLDGIAETLVGSILDGQAHQGYPVNNYGPRQCLAPNRPPPRTSSRSTSPKPQTGSDWRNAFYPLHVQGNLQGRNCVHRHSAQRR